MIFGRLILGTFLLIFCKNMLSLGQQDDVVNLFGQQNYPPMNMAEQQPEEDEDPCECGIPRKNIDPRDHKYPWIVSVEHGRSWSCVGTLINHEWVITSYACSVYYAGNQGVHNWTGTYVRFRVQENIRLLNRRLPVVNVIQRLGDAKLGIVLLKLADPVGYESKIRPICLPDPDKYKAPNNYTFLGWGPKTGFGVKETQMNYIPDSLCKAHMHSRLGESNTTEQFCTLNNTFPRNPCLFEDNGGPLMSYNSTNHRYYLSGIAANIVELCNRPNFLLYPLATISPRIERLVEKIKNITQICFPR